MRIKEAREELEAVLQDDMLRDAAVLMFANKQDLPQAMNTAEEVTDKLGLANMRVRHTGSSRTRAPSLETGLLTVWSGWQTH